jgi:hypothetical protein
VCVCVCVWKAAKVYDPPIMILLQSTGLQRNLDWWRINKDSACSVEQNKNKCVNVLLLCGGVVWMIDALRCWGMQEKNHQFGIPMSNISSRDSKPLSKRIFS